MRMNLYSKTCPCCNIEKDISEFDSHFIKKLNKIKIYSYCKECRRKRNNESSKAYYKNNRDSCLQYQKKFREKAGVKDKRREYKKKEYTELSDGIVASILAQQLKTTSSDIKDIPGLIETKRNQIKLIRKLKEHGKK